MPAHTSKKTSLAAADGPSDVCHGGGVMAARSGAGAARGLRAAMRGRRRDGVAAALLWCGGDV